MGTPIPWPNSAASCVPCWAPTKPFELYLTPQFIQVTVTDIIKGPNWAPPNPEPPNGFFELEWFFDCQWAGFYAPFQLFLMYDLHNTHFYIYWNWPAHIFGCVDAPCILGVDNTNPGFPLLYQHGMANWTWLGGP